MGEEKRQEVMYKAKSEVAQLRRWRTLKRRLRSADVLNLCDTVDLLVNALVYAESGRKVAEWGRDEADQQLAKAVVEIDRLNRLLAPQT